MHTRVPIHFKIFMAILIVAMLSASPLVTLAQSADRGDQVLAAEIDQLLTDLFSPDAPGAAIIVMRDGQVILRKGYGLANLELGVPVVPEMVFRLASVTKQFTAVAILMLVDEGKVTLNADITQYLPDYPTAGQTITIENLLTHTGGVKNYNSLPELVTSPATDRTLDELIGLFKDQPLDFVPGEAWSYSNAGYALLGAVIEQVSGLRYADFIQQRIFTPLGMDHSAYDNSAQIIAGRVPGYSQSSAGFINTTYLSMSVPYAAGALVSSVDDLARWDAALYTGQLVKPRTLQRAFRPYTLANGQSTGYGYGWEIGAYVGHTITQHSGGINGFSAQVTRLPDDKVYVAILTNRDGFEPVLGPLALRAAALVIGKPVQDPKPITLSTSKLARYEGVYRDRQQSSVVVRRDGGQLMLQSSRAPRQLIPFSSTDFFVRGEPTRIEFILDATGNVAALQLQQYGTSLVALRSDEPLPTERVAVEIDPAIYREYVGEYLLGPGFVVTVSALGDQLFAQGGDPEKDELLPESESKFFIAGVDIQIEFTRDDAANVTGFVLYQGGEAIPGQKVK